MSPTNLTSPAPGRAPKRLSKLAVAAAIVAGMLTIAGVAAATYGFSVRGGDGGFALVRCPGGMDRLGHVFSEDVSVFPGDPKPIINIVFNVEDDGFLVEEVTTGMHSSTHIDAPIHFGYTTSIDDFDAEDFVFPAYVIDVSDRVGEPGVTLLSWEDIRAHERRHGKINPGSMVIVDNGLGPVFGTEAFDTADSVGFSADAVNQLVANRDIAGIGSDYFGPDAADDPNFSGTDTALSHELLVLTNLANLDTMNTKGDIIMSPAVALIDGSGYQVDPLACHGMRRK